MKIFGHRIVASTFGAVAILGFGVGIGIGLETGASPARAQVGAGPAPAPAARANQGAGAAGVVPNLPPWTAVHIPLRNALSPRGMWAEVVASTSRWIVVQNQAGQQLPIASDRIRQFLVRWPSSVNDLSPASMVEATGFQSGQDTVMVDHLDVYEANAQNLVSPTLQNLGGPGGDPFGGANPVNRINPSFFDFFSGTSNSSWTELNDLVGASFTEIPGLANNSGLVHVVGRSNRINPVTLTGFGPSAVAVVPGPNGMSVTQVTLGTNSYAKKGDLVHLVPEGATTRCVDVSQLVLYKKIPLRQFQP